MVREPQGSVVVDGAEEIAGAVLTPDTLSRAWAAGINPRASLDAIRRLAGS